MLIPSWPIVLSRAVTRRGFFLTTLAGAALPLILSGCASVQALPTPGAAWKTQTGQLLYRGSKERSVIGEVVVRYSGPNEFALNFLSGPGFPLLKLQVNGTDVVAEGVLARGRWSGKIEKTPAPLQGWVGLRKVFTHLPKNLTTDEWTTQVRASGNRVEYVDARFVRTGERFAFHFGS